MARRHDYLVAQLSQHLLRNLHIIRTCALAGALVIFISCSVSSGNTTKSVALPAGNALDRLEVVDNSSNTYRLRGSSIPSYVTVIEECHLDKEASASARARQLFVGLEKLQIDQQRNVMLDSNSVLVTSVSAVLDGAQLGLTSYSVQSPSCITDIVFWSQDRSNSESGGAAPLDTLSNEERDATVRELIPILFQR